MKKAIAAAVAVVTLFLAYLLFVVIGMFGILLFIAIDSSENAEATCTVRAGATSGDSPAPGVPFTYEDDVAEAAKTSGLPPAVISAQIDAESGWDTKAVSHAGAAGIAQFMPGTWAQYGEGDPLNGEASIAAQGRYMDALMDLAEPHADDYAHQVELALAAYNWGDGNMARVGWDLTRIPAETAAYIEKITATGQTWYTSDCAPVADFQQVGDLGDGEWTNPLPGSTFTSGYGARNLAGMPAWVNNHVGIDLSTGGAGQVVAPTDLRVTNVYDTDGCVMAKATTTPDFGYAFCHLDRIDVSTGDKVERGTILGVEGGTAGSIGGRVATHLHFELYHPDAPDPKFPGTDAPGLLDPTPILKAKGAF